MARSFDRQRVRSLAVEAEEDEFMDIREAASELVSKGRGLAGSAARQVGDFANTAQIKAKLVDKDLERDRLMKELGYALYDTVKGDEGIVSANASLFERIAANATNRMELEAELDAIGQEEADVADAGFAQATAGDEGADIASEQPDRAGGAGTQTDAGQGMAGAACGE